MATRGYKALKFTAIQHGKDSKALHATDESKIVQVTIIVRRNAAARRSKAAAKMLAQGASIQGALTREEFEKMRGAAPNEFAAVVKFAEQAGLKVVDQHLSRRAVIVEGPVKVINKAFAITLTDYLSPAGMYFSHDGAAAVPDSVAEYIEAIIGLDDRRIHAVHHSTVRHRGGRDPVGTVALTPRQVAGLYGFPAGDGKGQVIGLYEMDTSQGRAGYTLSDLQQTMALFKDGSKVPRLVDVDVGAKNVGVSDGETGLDITVAGAVAPAATIAVYFAGSKLAGMVNTLQRMFHPGVNDPKPNVVSISYGWGEDEYWKGATGATAQAFVQMQQLFEDAALLGITVLVSTGDTGAMISDVTQAQAAYPATDPWVLACGGTSVGNIRGASFDEFVWNDFDPDGNHGATGGGVSVAFPVPSYQKVVHVPLRVKTGTSGRGIPDISGNASENSGYPQVINGNEGPVGGTSAVAPLYAGLLARINANLGSSSGYLNPLLYTKPPGVFNDITAAQGPTNNNFERVIGYSVTPGWDACTGLGSVNGKALQTAIQKAKKAGGS